MIKRSFQRGDLLLALLALLERQPMPPYELMGELDAALGDDYRVRVRDATVALEALEAEGLVERDGKCRRLAPDGAAALRERAEAEVLERIGPRAQRVTLLFTDVVGSTRLFERVGDDAAHELMQRHFALLRATIREHRGREVKSLGDGLMVAFGDPADAVACAHAMQRAVSASGDPLELRVGVASGDAMRDHGDYFGRPVIVASRLCDSAGRGEVLVACEPEGEQQPVRSLRLKGLSEPVIATALALAAG
ncbi:MAG: adenylate/guanylate cyclase domain-containing protein [Gaiellaceae bacterium]